MWYRSTYSVKALKANQGVNLVTGTGRTSVDIGVNANLELVDKFYYLGDMLSVDGDADAAVETKIRIGWNKFLSADSRFALTPICTYVYSVQYLCKCASCTRQLVPLLTNKDI